MKTAGGKVIKSEQVDFSRVPGGIVTRSGQFLGNAPRRDGLADLEKLKAGLVRKLQQTEQASYDRGLSDGIQKGRDIQKRETLEILQSMTRVIEEIAGLKKKMIEDVEGQIIGLALAVAEKVIQLEVTTNREIVRNVLREAIKSISDRENIKIRLHPQDFHYMVAIKSDFIQNFDGIRNIAFEEDESVQRGGAIIESLFGEIDARLEQQFSEIRKVMASPSG